MTATPAGWARGEWFCYVNDLAQHADETGDREMQVACEVVLGALEGWTEDVGALNDALDKLLQCSAIEHGGGY